MVKIGIDPEVFLKVQGKVVSAHGVIPGTKEKPFEVSKGAVQVDGMALEFNIIPTDNEDTFIENTQTVLTSLKAMLPARSTLVFNPVHTFTADYMALQPPEAKELGCNPDMNAYDMVYNPIPRGDVINFRTAAGHLHIGWRDDDEANLSDPLHIEECAMVARELDVALGAPSCLYEPFTAGKQRRSLYGAAGSFRPKPYGMEYRVLSNFWLKEERAMRWVFNTSKQVMKNIMSTACIRAKEECQDYREMIDKVTTQARLVRLLNNKVGQRNYSSDERYASYATL
jgi:hypothetical protein